MKRIALTLEFLAVITVASVWIWTSFLSGEAAPFGAKLIGTTSTAIVFALLLDLAGGRVLDRLEASQSPAPQKRRGIARGVRHSVWRRDGGCCQWRDTPDGPICGARRDLEFDHIKPWSKGGRDTERNLQLLCQTHNRRKGARTLEWLAGD
jgi:hypothetical protein